MTRRALAGRFILTTEHHPHGTHLKCCFRIEKRTVTEWEVME